MMHSGQKVKFYSITKPNVNRTGNMAARLKSVLSIGTGALVGGSYYALYADAPLPNNDDGKPYGLVNQSFPESFYQPARAVSITSVVLTAKLLLGKFNNFTSSGEDKLQKYIDERPKNQSLITVMNHTSTVDDPSIISCLLPLKYSLRLSDMSQEYCFQKGALVRALCYSGKVMPIHRGGGVDQKMLQDLFEKVQRGEWVHIFPEGKITQTGVLAGRVGPDVEKTGMFKWGVGKLIARAENAPLVVPIYHVGMKEVMPQRKQKLKSILPTYGQNVHVKVGEPIYLDDLLEEYSAIERENSWKSNEAERVIFSKITKRVEEAMHALEKDAHAEAFAAKQI